MPFEGKQDLRVQKTRGIIKQTFKEMIMEMKASDIKIKELTDRAMIHRKTFYLHYTCVEALFEDVMQELSEKYYEAIDKVREDAPFSEVNRVFFEFMSGLDPYMEKIVCDESYRMFSDRFFDAMLSHNRSRHNPYSAFSKEEQNVINTFLGLSSVNIYRRWVADGKKIPVSRLIELSGSLFLNGISSVV